MTCHFLYRHKQPYIYVAEIRSLVYQETWLSSGLTKTIPIPEGKSLPSAPVNSCVAASEGGGVNGMLTGGLIGTLLGVAVGYTIYAGLLRVPMRWFFAATSGLVLLLAAGMASTAARFLIQADLLPSLASPLWDTSSIVTENGVMGMLLHSLLGYDARPAGMQIVFYIMTLILIVVGMKLVKYSNTK